jgi:catechol 2,3-dioxygenase-like lactoylglutathione lyase family enzyme
VLVTGIDHVQLAMPEGGEDRAREFYGAVLGLPEVAKPAHLAKRGGCWFERGSVKIHLGVDPNFRPAQKAHAALAVDGLDLLVATLEAHGYPVRPGEPFDGHSRIYVDDPFGNRVEMIEAR